MPNKIQKTVKAAKKNAKEFLGAVVDNLSVQAKMERTKVSEATADLLRYIKAHEHFDPIVKGTANSEWKKAQPKKCSHQ